MYACFVPNLSSHVIFPKTESIKKIPSSPQEIQPSFLNDFFFVGVQILDRAAEVVLCVCTFRMGWVNTRMKKRLKQVKKTCMSRKEKVNNNQIC